MNSPYRLPRSRDEARAWNRTLWKYKLRDWLIETIAWVVSGLLLASPFLWEVYKNFH